MRVVECNFCGETLGAANDDDLVATFARHVADQHADAGFDEQAIRQVVERDAYDASDS